MASRPLAPTTTTVSSNVQALINKFERLSSLPSCNNTRSVPLFPYTVRFGLFNNKRLTMTSSSLLQPLEQNQLGNPGSHVPRSSMQIDYHGSKLQLTSDGPMELGEEHGNGPMVSLRKFGQSVKRKASFFIEASQRAEELPTRKSPPPKRVWGENPQRRGSKRNSKVNDPEAAGKRHSILVYQDSPQESSENDRLQIEATFDDERSSRDGADDKLGSVDSTTRTAGSDFQRRSREVEASIRKSTSMQLQTQPTPPVIRKVSSQFIRSLLRQSPVEQQNDLQSSSIPKTQPNHQNRPLSTSQRIANKFGLRSHRWRKRNSESTSDSSDVGNGDGAPARKRNTAHKISVKALVARFRQAEEELEQSQRLADGKKSYSGCPPQDFPSDVPEVCGKVQPTALPLVAHNTLTLKTTTRSSNPSLIKSTKYTFVSSSPGAPPNLRESSYRKNTHSAYVQPVHFQGGSYQHDTNTSRTHPTINSVTLEISAKAYENPDSGECSSTASSTQGGKNTSRGSSTFYAQSTATSNSTAERGFLQKANSGSSVTETGGYSTTTSMSNLEHSEFSNHESPEKYYRIGNSIPVIATPIAESRSSSDDARTFQQGGPTPYQNQKYEGTPAPAAYMGTRLVETDDGRTRIRNRSCTPANYEYSFSDFIAETDDTQEGDEDEDDEMLDSEEEEEVEISDDEYNEPIPIAAQMISSNTYISNSQQRNQGNENVARLSNGRNQVASSRHHRQGGTAGSREFIILPDGPVLGIPPAIVVSPKPRNAITTAAIVKLVGAYA